MYRVWASGLCLITACADAPSEVFKATENTDIGHVDGQTDLGTWSAALKACTDAQQCDDDKPCTRDRCVFGECVRTKIGICCDTNAQCDDANLCTSNLCEKGLCVFRPIPCVDEDPCTIDWCEAPLGCVHLPEEEQCLQELVGGGSLCDVTGVNANPPTVPVTPLPCIGSAKIANGPCGKWMHFPGKPGQFAYDVVCKDKDAQGNAMVVSTGNGVVVSIRKDIKNECSYTEWCGGGGCPYWCCPKGVACSCPPTPCGGVPDVALCLCNSKFVESALGDCPESCGPADFGNYVVVKREKADPTENGDYLVYPHCAYDSIKVSPEQEVCPGLLLCYQGKTGVADGPHTHYVLTDQKNGSFESTPLALLYIKDGVEQTGEPPLFATITSTLSLVASCCGNGECSEKEKQDDSCPADCGESCVPTQEVCDLIDQDCDGNLSEGTCPLPPASQCIGTSTLRMYATGVCEQGSCQYPFTDLTCNDQTSCTIGACQNGSCVTVPLLNDCGNQTCGLSTSGCHWCGNCNSMSSCNNGFCIPTSCPECQILQDDTCVFVGKGTLCGDDGDACTEDVCELGVCQHLPKTQNACGGCGYLSTQPGTWCGGCKSWECIGSNTVSCQGPEANACGGCSSLIASPGSPCGSMCSVWQCNDSGSITCQSQGTCTPGQQMDCGTCNCGTKSCTLSCQWGSCAGESVGYFGDDLWNCDSSGTVCVETQQKTGANWEWRVCKKSGAFNNNVTLFAYDANNWFGDGIAYAECLYNQATAGKSCTNWQNINVSALQQCGVSHGVGLSVTVYSPATCTTTNCNTDTGKTCAGTFELFGPTIYMDCQ